MSVGQPRRAAPPRRIGAYDILREVGRGGMGVVHEAMDRRLGRRVALKELAPALWHEQGARDRLDREARALAAINHPNVALIYGLEEDGGDRYLVLELVEGTPLSARLAAGALPVREALSICAQVAAAMAAVHARGIVHCDLKGGNVMLTHAGVAKLVDFGLAQRTRRRPRDGAAAGPMIPAAFTGGTPGFMSPEQIRGEAVDERSDAWAFGCLLYQCLTGDRAFDGEMTQERVAATLEHEPDLARLPPDLPPPARDLLRRCLARDLDRRLSSLAEAERILSSTLAEDASRSLRDAPPSAPPGNIPQDLTQLVGREAERAELAALLADRRLVTITGPGGCGKTRLAVDAARARRPSGGAWLVELAEISDPALVPAHAAAALGLPDEPGRSATEVLVGHLAASSALLVLDGCEHVLDACASLASSLVQGCPGLGVLATSREALGVRGEGTFVLGPLSLPPPRDASPASLLRSDAVALFVERARAASPRFELTASNAAAVGRACRMLDGIPLAIELAAARLRHLSTDQLVERLDDRLRLLTGGSRAGLPRQQTLRAAIDWSHDHLAEAEQVLYRRLSAFRGGWTLDMAEAVGAGEPLPAEDVLDVLSRLVDKSLVVLDAAKSPPRYRFLETIRQHAREKLLASGESEAVHERHAGAVLALLEAASAEMTGRHQAEWLERFAADHENVAEAFETSVAQPDDGARALRIVDAAWRYWFVRGHLHECREKCARALERGASAPAPLRAAALHASAVLAWRLGDLGTAHALALEDLETHRALGDQRGVATALAGLGRIALDRHDLEEARARFERACEVARACNDPHVLATAIEWLSFVLDEAGDADGARRLQEESLALSRRSGDAIGVAGALNNLGYMVREQGDGAAARALFEECLVSAVRLGARELIAVASNNLGRVACDAGDLPRARDMLQRGLAMALEIADRRRVAAALVGLADVVAGEGDAELAARLLGSAEACFRSIGAVTDLRRDRERIGGGLSAVLGAESYEARHAEGAALPVEDAASLPGVRR